MNIDFEYMVNLMVNQSLINKENNAKIRPEYKQQVLDALILKAAEEIGIYRGNRTLVPGTHFHKIEIDFVFEG